MAMPMLFFVRRLTMCYSLVFMRGFVWGQIALQAFVTLTMIIYLMWFRPYKSQFSNRIETFNEVMALLILYSIICFTDFVPEVEMKGHIGTALICAVCFYASVHLLFMFKQNYL